MGARKAFTLIELLVVISIIALLMAILMPCLQRVRKQAKDMRCLSNLRQWGVILHVYSTDHPDLARTDWWPDVTGYLTLPHDRLPDSTRQIVFCPAATMHTFKELYPPGPGRVLATGESSPIDPRFSDWQTSYGVNAAFCDWHDNAKLWEMCWKTFEVRGAAEVPLLLDSWYGEGSAPGDETEPPRQYEYFLVGGEKWRGIGSFCTGRHDGVTSTLFLDWSVRKVGLKELWTLKWHRKYNTHGPWTKRGGAQPEDWPAWMRRFKDY